VWIQRAQRNSGGLDSEPRLESIARDARGFDDGVRTQILDDVAKRDVGGRQNDAELVRREHHRNARSRQRAQHFRVTGKVVASREQGRFVDGGGHDSVDGSGLRHFDRTLDGEPTEHSGERRVRARPPLPD